jgi:NADPH-dependent 2,4-dienoyl-CoA reductase/sulfur reductase-like enzyme
VWDVAIVGGGPAGMAASVEAARHGLSVIMFEERVALGGQIYKQFGPGFVVKDPSAMGRDYRDGQKLLGAVQESKVMVRTNTSVLSIYADELVVVSGDQKAETIRARRIILAPGAHDRPVVFPGWTLPGVITAGGAQTMVKTQRVVPGERILFAGSGPLALAFPAQLRKYGANVIAALEAGPAPRLNDLFHLAVKAPRNFSVLRDALTYRLALLRFRVPLHYRRIIVRAEGEDRVEMVVHAKADADWHPIPGTEERVAVDTLCIGYGFFPSTELMRLAGCEMEYDENLGGSVVRLDEWMRTTVPNVCAVGDGAGVEGSIVAIAQAQIAAVGIAADLGFIGLDQAESISRPWRDKLRVKRAFAKILQRMHNVGSGVYELDEPDTIVCRCEGVRSRELQDIIESTSDIPVIKGFTRAGMGLCQGRNCQHHVAAMISRHYSIPVAAIPLATARFPVRPVFLRQVADDSVESKKYFVPDAESADD